MDKTETFLEYKRLLFSVAYDMLGVIADAEDVVQETYLKWIAADTGKVEYPKAFLVKIATNLSINYLNSAKVKREESIGTWLPELLADDESQDASRPVDIYSSLTIGMMVLLERLSSQERAIFLLKEVFSYDYREISDVMEKSEDNCRQIFKRARQHLGEEKSRYHVDLKAHEKLVNEFLKACTDGNIDSLIRLLKEDITIYADSGTRKLVLKGHKIGLLAAPLTGARKVASFVMSVISRVQKFSDSPFRKHFVVGGMPCVVTYSGVKPINLTVLETDGERVSNIYSYGNPEKIEHILGHMSSEQAEVRET